MARKNVKTIVRRPKVNWSHETTGISLTIPSEKTNGLYQAGSVVVTPSSVQGVRTVGNWTITVPVSSSAATAQILSATQIYWALVFVPQGTSANALFSTTGDLSGSLYEPNQFVLASGIADPDAGPLRIRSRIMRKLQSNDQISLILGSTAIGTSVQGRALVSYSIKYN
ncbi:hypothetical protein [Bovine serum-associated circular virus]|uniref:hypothetical protein n=1 Tax=Bovine serum-associated circular virus TaxID=2340909 RepID=UPI000EB62BC5|nr:hypothetical protein [Bovine serum-associated circular virus]AYA60339.1 hypothetical protein [Bovine serum-associated circular virus]